MEHKEYSVAARKAILIYEQNLKNEKTEPNDNEPAA